jgi:hypothetical protein
MSVTIEPTHPKGWRVKQRTGGNNRRQARSGEKEQFGDDSPNGVARPQRNEGSGRISLDIEFRMGVPKADLGASMAARSTEVEELVTMCPVRARHVRQAAE